MGIEKEEYAEFLEDAVKTLFNIKPVQIALVARTEQGNTLTAYYHCDAEDKAIMAHHIQSDVVMDIIENNAETVKEMLESE